MKPKSRTLFHFTESAEILRSILVNGFWPRYSLEDLGWQTSRAEDIAFAAFPMVCFCDIPLARIGEHIDKYGGYGIGMSREWGVESELNPLLYIAGSHNTISRSLKHVARLARSFQEGDHTLSPALLRQIASFAKPLSGCAACTPIGEEQDFYQESEWRYVPVGSTFPQFLTNEQYVDTYRLELANAAVRKEATLGFGLNDVRFLVVRSESEVPDLVRFIDSELRRHSVDDTRLLMSRITSVETIRDSW